MVDHTGESTHASTLATQSYYDDLASRLLDAEGETVHVRESDVFGVIGGLRRIRREVCGPTLGVEPQKTKASDASKEKKKDEGRVDYERLKRIDGVIADLERARLGHIMTVHREEQVQRWQGRLNEIDNQKAQDEELVVEQGRDLEDRRATEWQQLLETQAAEIAKARAERDEKRPFRFRSTPELAELLRRERVSRASGLFDEASKARDEREKRQAELEDAQRRKWEANDPMLQSLFRKHALQRRFFSQRWDQKMVQWQGCVGHMAQTVERAHRNAVVKLRDAAQPVPSPDSAAGRRQMRVGRSHRSQSLTNA